MMHSSSKAEAVAVVESSSDFKELADRPSISRGLHDRGLDIQDARQDERAQVRGQRNISQYYERMQSQN